MAVILVNFAIQASMLLLLYMNSNGVYILTEGVGGEGYNFKFWGWWAGGGGRIGFDKGEIVFGCR